VPGLYRALLGDQFGSLHPAVQRAHAAPLRAEGAVDVVHGTHWLGPFLVWMMNLPAPGPRQPTTVDIRVSGCGLVWTRTIGASRFRTRQNAEGSLLVERLGLGRVAFALDVDAGALRYRQVSMSVARIAVPPSLGPRVSVGVCPASEGWHVQVEVTWRAHLVCRYSGVMRRV